MRAWSGRAGQVVEAVVDDRTRVVTEAWVGPQVAWKMARGRPGAFGGRTLTSWPVWVGLSLVFLLGLADLRRPLRLRNLDLLMLLSFGVSLAFFDAGSGVRLELARRSPARLPARPHGLDRIPRPAPQTCGAGVADLGAPRGDALPRRVSRRDERADPEVGDRRGVRRRDRRRQDPRRSGAVGRDAPARRAPRVRQRRRRRRAA